MTGENIEILWEACGARSPLILDLFEHAKLVHAIQLDFPFATIGRSANNDVVLGHSQVSRRHAYLQVIEGRIFCVDLNSRTGTHRQTGAGSGWVEAGEALQIGPFTLRPRELPRHESAIRFDHGDTHDPLQSFPMGADPFPAFMLHFLGGVREQSSWEMHRVLALVGSSRECKVQLIDPRVSRYHGVLLRTQLGTWVIDLQGRGGVRVNGTRVRFARLCDRDELQVGLVRMGIECDTQRSDSVAGDESLQSRARDPADIAENPGLVMRSTDLLARSNESLFAPPTSIVPPGLVLPATPVPSDVDASQITAPRGTAPGNLTVSANLNPLSVSEQRGSIMVEQENLISILLYQFGQMHQQMAEQFQQAVMTMVQMFSAFHRDQMDLVRDELNRLYELNQEIVAIQAELARQHPPHLSQTPPAKMLVAPAPFGSAVPLSDARERSFAERGSEAEYAGQAMGAEAVAQQQNRLQNELETAAASPTEGGNGRTPTDSPQQPGGLKDSGADPRRPSGEDVHAMLWQRMEAFRAEQQTLWQKILTTVRTTVTGNS